MKRFYTLRIPSRTRLAMCLAAILALSDANHVAIAGGPLVKVTDCTDDGGSTTLRSLLTPAVFGTLIDLSACANSTITLTAGEIAFSASDVFIQGPSSGTVTISGNHNGRVFNATGSVGNLVLQYLTLIDGTLASSGNNQELYGGCIYAKSGVALTHVTLSGCSVIGTSDGDNAQGGAIFSKGAVTLTHSTVTGNVVSSTSTTRSYAYGGGVDAIGGVNAYYSSVTNNVASIGSGAPNFSTGGGLSSSQAVILKSTVIASNQAGHGGGIYTQNGASSFTNTTISGNSALQNGGGVITHGTIGVTTSTFNGNSAGNMGGAVYASNSASFTNSTISGNTSGAAGGGIWATNATLYFATVYANHYTTAGSKGAGLYFTNSAMATASIFTGNGSYDIGAPSNIPLTGSFDIIAASGVSTPADATNCDVKLGPLANFGGTTKTLPLGTGSCAIDKGPSSPTTTTDQRAKPRPVQLTGATARADIGAFEKQSATDPDYIFISGLGPAGSN